jgi:hypothetical protein
VSAERVAVVRSIVDRLDAHDAEGPAEPLHPQSEFRSLLASVGGKSCRDLDGLREYFAEIARQAFAA